MNKVTNHHNKNIITQQVFKAFPIKALVDVKRCFGQYKAFGQWVWMVKGTGMRRLESETW